MDNTIALLKNAEIATLFDSSLKPVLEQIEKEVSSIVPDTTNKKGRDAIKSLAYKVTKSKTAIDAQGKTLVDEINKQMKEFTDKKSLINASRKESNTFLKALSEKVRQPLSDYNTAEAEKEQKKLILKDWDDAINENLLFDKSVEIEEKEALLAKEQVDIEAEKERLRRDEEIREQERARAEVARINAIESEKRAVKAEDDRKKALRQIEIDRQGAEKRQREQELKNIAAQQEQKELAEKRQREQKLKNIAAQQEQKELAEKRQQEAVKRQQEYLREQEICKMQKAKSDFANVKFKNNAAMQDFILEGIEPDTAKKIVILIARDKISYIEINY